MVERVRKLKGCVGVEPGVLTQGTADVSGRTEGRQRRFDIAVSADDGGGGLSWYERVGQTVWVWVREGRLEVR